MSSASDLQFDHLGLAVKLPDQAIRFLQCLGYSAGARVHDPLQGVDLMYCTCGGKPSVEIVMPCGVPGPLDSILRGRSELVYHECYRTRDVAKVISDLRTAGNRIICVSPPKPAVLFGGRLVSFYHVHGFGLIELLESES